MSDPGSRKASLNNGVVNMGIISTGKSGLGAFSFHRQLVPTSRRGTHFRTAFVYGLHLVRRGALPLASPQQLRRWGLACGLALITACSGANAINTGPFNGDGTNSDRNDLCVPVGPGGVLSYGLDSFTNSGGTATIERVALTDPHNLQVLAAYAVPLTGSYLYGVLKGAPPARHLPAGVHWAQRQQADGAVIPPGAQTNLVLVLKPAGTKGTARSVDVFYRSDGQQYHFQTSTTIEVLVANSCPS